MSSRWIQTFEGRIAWYTIISLAATGIVEVVMAFLIYKVAGKLRYMGYRSAMLGPDGLYPGYRLMILGVCGALTFLFTFYALIHKYMSYVRMLERAMRDIANGNLDQEKFHGKKQQKKGNAHPGQTTRLQVHTRKQETKSQNPAQQKPDVENTEIPVAEKVLTEEKQEQQVKEVAVRQENNGAEIRKPEHRKYRKYHNYRKYPQKNRKTQESSKVIRPILSAGE